MTSVTITKQTPVRQLSNGTGYGTRFFSGRRANGETFEVALRPEAAAIVKEGDVIEYWDSGRSDYCIQNCGGKITKVNGTVYALEGYRDLGIDTGHPPVLWFKKEQVWGVVDVEIEDKKQYLWANQNRLFVSDTGYSFYALGDLTIERLLTINTNCAEHKSLPSLAPNQRIEWNNSYYGWATGVIRTYRKVIKKIDTDRALVVSHSYPY